MIWFLAVLCIASNPVSEPKGLLQSVENFYRQKKTLRANFVQDQWIEATEQNKKTEGTLEVQLPGKFRWETIGPSPSLVISDSKQVWFYTPPFTKDGRGQVLVKQVGGHQAELLQALLAGNLSRIRTEKLKPISCKDCPAGSVAIELVPKKGTAAGVSVIRVVIAKKDLQVHRVELVHKSGNRSKIALNHIRLGEGLPNEHFQFKAPSETDMITDGVKE